MALASPTCAGQRIGLDQFFRTPESHAVLDSPPRIIRATRPSRKRAREFRDNVNTSSSSANNDSDTDNPSTESGFLPTLLMTRRNDRHGSPPKKMMRQPLFTPEQERTHFQEDDELIAISVNKVLAHNPIAANRPGTLTRQRPRLQPLGQRLERPLSSVEDNMDGKAAQQRYSSLRMRWYEAREVLAMHELDLARARTLIHMEHDKMNLISDHLDTLRQELPSDTNSLQTQPLEASLQKMENAYIAQRERLLGQERVLAVLHGDLNEVSQRIATVDPMAGPLL